MGPRSIDNHSDGAYSVLRFVASCPTASKVLEVGYRLFFDIDPQHRGLLNLLDAGRKPCGILSVDAPTQRFALGAPSRREQFADYLKEGVLHQAGARRTVRWKLLP